MPLVARGDGADVVNTGHNSCIAPIDIKTNSCSSNVFVHNKGIHRFDDTNEEHDHCPPSKETQIILASPNVFANNLRLAREGDKYDCEAYIKKVNQPNVFANS